MRSFLIIPTQERLELRSDNSFHYISYRLSHKILLARETKICLKKLLPLKVYPFPIKCKIFAFCKYKIPEGLYENLTSTIIHVDAIVHRLDSVVHESFEKQIITLNVNKKWMNLSWKIINKIHELSFSWIHSSWIFVDAAYVHELESWIMKSSWSKCIKNYKFMNLEIWSVKSSRTFIKFIKVHELWIHENESSWTILISSRKVHSLFKKFLKSSRT